jgi:TonB-dependent starch-binding outer membrane protein SusC
VGPGGAAAVEPGAFGNANIGPEVGEEIELGFEGALLNDRITLDFTYFYQKVTDALGTVPLAPSRGFSGNMEANIARIDNWGWEASVNADVVRSRNVGFSLGLNGSHSMNRLKDLGPLSATPSRRVGFPFPAVTSSLVLSGELDSLGRPVNMLCDAGTGYMGLQPGGAAVPCAQTEDYQILLGTEFPQYIWGIMPTLTLYRNFEVFGLVDGEFGRWGRDTGLYCRHTGCFSNTLASLVRDDPAYVEGVVYMSRHPTDLTRDRIYDADFFKLREVGARYQVPRTWLDRSGIDRATVSLTGRNLWWLWRRQTQITGANIPDHQTTSPTGASQLFQWPSLSSVTAAVRVSF